MADTPYPNLYAIYRDRAKDKKENRLPTAIGVGVLSLLVLIACVAAQVSDGTIVISAVVGLIYSIITTLVYTNGFQSFDRIWEKNVAEFCEAINGADILRRVEDEIAEGSVYYPEVLFTKNFMITFKAFGDIYPVTDIDLLDITEWRPRTNNPFDKEVYYNLNCIAGARHALLSSDEEQIREILHEIRTRFPDVELTPRAHAFFFPTPVRVE